MIGLDTNLLVYAHRSRVVEHAGAKRAIERARKHPRGCGIPVPCLTEFWAVVTHGGPADHPSSADQAAAFLRSLREAGIDVWLPTAGFEERMVDAAASLGATGSRVFDVQIGVIARDHGATQMWTHDAGFLACPGLRRVDPLIPNRESR